MSPTIPHRCKACQAPLEIRHLYVDDGCPCNGPKGVNFPPSPCPICDTECSRPGHHLGTLFGLDAMGIQFPQYTIKVQEQSPVPDGFHEFLKLIPLEPNPLYRLREELHARLVDVYLVPRMDPASQDPDVPDPTRDPEPDPPGDEYPRAPRDDEEREAVSDTLRGPCCPATMAPIDEYPLGCTRLRDHTGDHVAGGPPLVYARWTARRTHSTGR